MPDPGKARRDLSGERLRGGKQPEGGRGARLVVWAVGLMLIAASLLPLAPTDDWWVRALDFPRPELAVLLVLAGLAAWSLPGRGAARRDLRWGLLAGLAAALFVQLYWLWPYTPLHPAQALAAEGCAQEDRLSVVSVNIQAHNSGAGPFLDAVRTLEPDLVFVVEVDPGWVKGLSPLEAGYPHRLLHPRDDYWGFALYSRLELIGPRARHLLSGYVPSAETGLRLRSGAVVGFHGLHPRPPLPGHGTGQRDAEMLLAAQAIRQAGRPALLGGDLNTVAWSATSALVRRIGGLLDPRVGRGFYASFPNWLPAPLRVPIDQILVTPEFRLLEFRTLADIGSDHLPLYAVLCHMPGPAPAPPASEADRRRAEEAIQDGREDAARGRPPD